MKIETKGPEIGFCGICNAYGKLTEDHVPPKGSSRLKNAEMMGLVNILGAELPSKGNRLLQDGVKFRSLCSICNNIRLGRDADPELIKLVNDVSSILNSRLSLPNKLSLKIDPRKVLNSVIGHTLACGVNRVPAGPFEEELQKLFLDSSYVFSDRLSCLYWIYPYNDQVIIRDAVACDLRHTNEITVFKLLKFYPLAFMLCWEKSVASDSVLNNYLDLLTELKNGTNEITIDLANFPRRRWPELPLDRSWVVVYGGEPAYAKEKLPSFFLSRSNQHNME